MFVKFVYSICYFSVVPAWSSLQVCSVVSSIYMFQVPPFNQFRSPAFVCLLNMLCKYAIPFIYATGVESLLYEFKTESFK